MNMIEKVARAICEESFIGGILSVTKESWIEYNWKRFIPQAKAAIKAMEQPTDDMIEHVTVISIELEGNIPHRIAYQEYIKQALNA